MEKIPCQESPLDYGRRLIPTLVDEIAHSDPQRPFISIAKSPDLKDGFEDITYAFFARAVNRCAWWMQKELGESKTPRPLLYLGPLDLRYLLIILAAAKTRNIVCLPPLIKAGRQISKHLCLGFL